MLELTLERFGDVVGRKPFASLIAIDGYSAGGRSVSSWEANRAALQWQVEKRWM